MIDRGENTFAVDVVVRPGAISFRVKVVPRARRSTIAGVEGGVLQVRLSAPPVEGKANEALCAFLGEVLGVRQSAVRIQSGDRSRHKIVEVAGVTPDEARGRLAAHVE